MPLTEDPFEVLGVPADADLEQVRAAYRQAVLECHPDTHPADRQEAARRFYEVTEAYRRCLQACAARMGRQANAQADPVSPQEYALRDAEWLVAAVSYSRWAQAARDSGTRGWPKISVPTMDETRAFACLWPLAMVLGVGVSAVVAEGLVGRLDQGTGVALVLGAYLLVYTGSLALAVGGLVLTRRVIVLALQIAGYCARRALPGRSDRPELPRRSRWRLGRRTK